jgi:allantoicase
MISLEGCYSKLNNIKNFKWKTLISKKKTKANNHHIFKSSSKSIFTHIRFNIFPDGGIARLRLYGNILKKNNNFINKKINLASLLDGASVIACNNEHFGRAENVIAPGRGKNMGDGWETRRSRGKNFDWLIIKFGKPGLIKKLEIDTHHFKGNYPDTCSIQTANITKKLSNKLIVNNSKNWKYILNKSKLSANKKHTFKKFLIKRNKENYLKINICPDGGISRIRAFGNFVK